MENSTSRDCRHAPGGSRRAGAGAGAEPDIAGSARPSRRNRRATGGGATDRCAGQTSGGDQECGPRPDCGGVAGAAQAGAGRSQRSGPSDRGGRHQQGAANPGRTQGSQPGEPAASSGGSGSADATEPRGKQGRCSARRAGSKDRGGRAPQTGRLAPLVDYVRAGTAGAVAGFGGSCGKGRPGTVGKAPGGG